MSNGPSSADRGARFFRDPSKQLGSEFLSLFFHYFHAPLSRDINANRSSCAQCFSLLFLRPGRKLLSRSAPIIDPPQLYFRDLDVGIRALSALFREHFSGTDGRRQ